MKRIATLILVLIFLSNGLSAQITNISGLIDPVDKIFGDAIVFGFTFWVADKDQINDDLTNIISIDNVKPAAKGGFDVRAFANKREFSAFLSRNISWEPLKTSSAGKAYNMAATTALMSAWDKYPVYSVYEQMLANFAATYPTLCNVDTILTATPNGHRILALKISDNVNASEDEPRFFYSSSIHGDETTGFILLLRLANYLLSNYGTVSRITDMVNNIEIWICPLANPDGTYYSGDDVIGPYSSPLSYVSIRGNANGIDLNRNYPDPRTGANPDGNAYQPETQAFMAFADLHHFNMAANFHGGAEVANYPWDTWKTATNANATVAWWERVCTAYVDTCRLVDGTYMTDTYSDGVTEGGDWYVITGGRQDYMNYFQFCREVTLEVDGEKTTQTQNLNAAWNRNYRALLNYLQESRYGIRGIITDSCTGQPIQAKVFVNSYDQANDSSHVYSWLPVGDYHKYLTAGTYSVTFSAPGYTSKTITNVITSNVSATVLNVSLVTTALPEANFSADVVSTCTGIVNFTDLSSGAPTSWTWTFGDSYGSSAQNPTHQYTANGTYTVALTATNCKGNNVENKISYINVNLVTNPVANNGSHCGSGVVPLSASGNGTLNWYDAEIDGNLVNTGTNYSPNLTTTTSFYIDNTIADAPVYGAKLDNTGGGSNLDNPAQYEIFTSYTPFTLVSVDVYASATGNRTFELRNSSGDLLQSAVVDITATSVAFTVPLNFSVPAGTNLQLGLNSTSACNLYRNNAGVVYPFTSAGLMSVTNSSAGATYYYYLYNWKLQKPGCTTGRVEVIASINPLSVASFSQSQNAATVTFTNTSQNAVSYAWDFGDGQTSTLTDPVHTYDANGNYTVRLITTNACGSDTAYNTVEIVTVGGVSATDAVQHVSIYPNPARTILHLTLNTSSARDCRYEIINMVGEIVLTGAVNFQTGVSNASVDVSNLNQGVYFIKLMMDEGSVIRKIIIE